MVNLLFMFLGNIFLGMLIYDFFLLNKKVFFFKEKRKVKKVRKFCCVNKSLIFIYMDYWFIFFIKF